MAQILTKEEIKRKIQPYCYPHYDFDENYERYQLHEQGYSFHQLGRMKGVSSETIRESVHIFEKKLARAEREANAKD